MSVPPHRSPDRDAIELESAVHWPTVAAGAALLLGLIACFLVPLVLSEPATPPRTQAAVASAIPPVLPSPHRLRPTPEIPRPAPPAPKTVKPSSAPPKPVVMPEAVVENRGRLLREPAPNQRALLAQAKPAPVSLHRLAVDRPSAAIAAQRKAEANARAALLSTFKHRKPHHDSMLGSLLTKIPVVDLDAEKGASSKLITTEASRRAGQSKQQPNVASPTIHDVVAQRSDLEGLPLRKANACQVDEKDLLVMAKISPMMRRWQRQRRIAQPQSPSQILILRHDERLVSLLDKQTGWLKEASVSSLVQMLQVENEPVRLQLVKMLAQIKGPKASEALARRALHDIAPQVREQAVKALKERPRSEYCAVLLDGLRYPLPLVSDHAAEALVALKDRDATPALVKLLDAPDPCTPVLGADHVWRVREVVRINHLRNCLLCHEQSFERTEVRGLVPTPGRPLQEVYDQRGSGTFVRADRVYLRQDFSVMMSVEKADPWPTMQRFDFVVRQRKLKPAEVERWRSTQKQKAKAEAGKKASAPPLYPQRGAVLFALRELTGLDAGSSTEGWQRVLQSMRSRPENSRSP